MSGLSVLVDTAFVAAAHDGIALSETTSLRVLSSSHGALTLLFASLQFSQRFRVF